MCCGVLGGRGRGNSCLGSMDVGDEGDIDDGDVGSESDSKESGSTGALIDSESVSKAKMCAKDSGEEKALPSMLNRSLGRSWLSGLVLHDDGNRGPFWCDRGSA